MGGHKQKKTIVSPFLWTLFIVVEQCRDETHAFHIVPHARMVAF